MLNSAFDLNGKVAIVTGGSRGLGKAIAEGLAQAGADVAVVSRTKNEGEQSAQDLRRFGRKALAVQVDLARVSEIYSMFDQVVVNLGRVDILVNAAGNNIRKPVVDFTEEDWESLMSVQLKAVFFASQVAARIMIKQGSGKIINIGSITSVEFDNDNIVLYGIAKHGVMGITRGMAKELAPYSINVNAIGPGWFRTKQTESVFKDEVRVKRFLSRIPQKRFGIPSDLAGAAVFLASQASNYITGQMIFVDGGWLVN